MATFSKNELEELESVTTVYDKIGSKIHSVAGNSSVYNKIVSLIRNLNQKNNDTLLSNIVGYKLLINKQFEDSFFQALGLERKEIEASLKESVYFKKFGDLKLIDQLVTAFPILLYSFELAKLKKIQDAKLIYLLSFYKPYASRISFHFKFGVNEDQMLYTVEHLSDRFDIKKLGSVYNVLIKKSDASYENYITNALDKEKLSDRYLHVMYNSGVASRVNATIGEIAEEYKKNSGKALGFEAGASEVYDKDDDTNTFVDSNIESDAAIKLNVVNNAINDVMSNPVNSKYVQLAVAAYFPNSQRMYMDVLTKAINEIVDKMGKELPAFFSAIVGAFLFEVNPSTKEKYTMSDFKSAIFLRAAMSIFKMKNLKNENLLLVKKTINKMLENCVPEYSSMAPEGTQQRCLRNALYFYWVLIVKNGGKLA